MWFEALSGLKINLDKSEPTPIVRVENIDELVSKLGCKQGNLLSTYLGLPLGAPFRSIVVWDGVEERFSKWLSMRERQDISKGDRITLINSYII